ncbi:MAG TPA: right-handed parallel beta-helix repeat-containing protein [Thermoplasmata archaeon]|jgi:parallel beta-helix repeat protein|nr:right-handed parallel beta-helix repeat-containing protein [Thermoplasmata archaeon]
MVKLEAIVITIGLLGGALALLALDPRPLAFDAVFVAGDGDCAGNTPCVPTIGEGLSLVNRSGTVFVYGFNGTYNGTVNIDFPVTIRGESRDLVTVDGEWRGGAVVQIGSGGGVTLAELTLINNDYGIEVQKFQDLRIQGVRITDTYGGLLATDVTGLVLEGSEILRTQAYDGVEIQHSRFVTIGGAGNNVSDNAGRGIFVNDSQEVTIADNVIMNNDLTGLNVSYSVNVTVADNMIVGNGMGSPITTSPGPGPSPMQGQGGGLWFWQTDPTAVERNLISMNGRFGVEIGGIGSTDLVLRDNEVTQNDGVGIIVNQGASRITIADMVTGNGGSGIYLDNVTDVTIESATISDNSGVGVHGQFAMNIAVRDSMISGNCAVIPIATRSSPSPSPLSGHGGGLWFWQTDPSVIAGNDITGNCAQGITLQETLEFDILDNMIAGNHDEEILLVGATDSVISGNTILGGDLSTIGTALVDSRLITIGGNAYRDLPVGILISGGCDIGLGLNSFLNVTTPLLLERNPCNVLFSGTATLRFMPSTLNLKSHGQFATLTFDVEGLDPAQFDVSTLVFTVNGVLLVPPPGSPSTVHVHGDVISAMVKLDRAEVIAAFGTSGTYEVTVSGEFMPGVRWVASDTVEAILP